MATGSRLVILEGNGPAARRHVCKPSAQPPRSSKCSADEQHCYAWLRKHGISDSVEIRELLAETRARAVAQAGRLYSLDSFALRQSVRDGELQVHLLEEIWLERNERQYAAEKADRHAASMHPRVTAMLSQALKGIPA